MENAKFYIVKKGDTLWDLAVKFLNDPKRWPEIWHFNNKSYTSPAIHSKMKPSMYIKNPDLIFVGQKLLIPTSNNRRQLINPDPTEKGRTPAKEKVRLVPYKYKIENKVFEAYLTGGFTATITIAGAVTIQSEKTVSWAEFNNEGLDIKIAKEYETPLNKLVSEYQLGINEKTGQIDFSCGVTMHSGIPFSPKYQAKISLNPLTGTPKYTTTVSYPEIKGKLADYFYTATGYSVVIEIEKQLRPRRQLPIPVAVRQTVPARAPVKNGGPDWTYVSGVLLLVGAVVVVTATVVEDIITLGAGAADDPASFALAGTMTARGMMLLRGAPVTITQLGRYGMTARAVGH